MKKREQDISGAAFILLLSTVAVKLIGAFFKVPLSSDRFLGDLGFGYFSAAYDLYTPIYTLAFSGFPVAIARMTADLAARDKTDEADAVFRMSRRYLIPLGAAGALLLFLLSFPLVHLIDAGGGSLYTVWCLAPALLFCSISAVYRGYFEGKKNMVPTAVSNTAEALCKLIIGLSFALAAKKLTGNPAVASAAAMLGITVGTAASAVILKLGFIKQNRRQIKSHESVSNEKRLLKQMLKIAFPIVIASLSLSFNSLIDTLTVRKQLISLIAASPANAQIMLRGTAYSADKVGDIATLLYGIRSKEYTLFDLAPTFTTVIGVGALPLITECYAKKDKNGVKRNSDIALKLAAVVSFPAAAGFVFIGRRVSALLYGSNSAVLGGKLLVIYGIATFFAGLSITLTSLLQSVGKQNEALVYNFVGVGVKLVMNLLLVRVPQINIGGCVIATCCSYAVVFLLLLVGFCRASNVVPDILNVFVKPLLSAILCGLTALAVTHFVKGNTATVCAVLAAAAVYFGCLFGFGTLKTEEFGQILGNFEKNI